MKIEVGDFIEYCTNPNFEKGDHAFIIGFNNDEIFNVRCISYFKMNEDHRDTLISDREYLFNKPNEYSTFSISSKHIRKVFK